MVETMPWVWLVGAIVVGGVTAMWWTGYTWRVRIDADAVRVNRGFRPWPRRYPRPAYDRILRRDNFVYLTQSATVRIFNPPLSPALKSADEARWVAWMMRRALR